jgi:hypothetical protein
MIGVKMKNNWETMSNNYCLECGHLLADSKDFCTFCSDLQIYDYKDLSSLDQNDNYISFDDEIHLGGINYDDEL